MKHRFNQLIIFAALLKAAAAFAQPSEVALSLKGGVDAATTVARYRTNKYGLTGGIASSLRWSITDRFSLGGQAELLYMPRGTRVIFEGEYVGQIRHQYTDLTLTARPEMRFGSMNVYLLLGGTLSYLMHSGKDDAAGLDQDITDGLHRIDLSVLGAVGIARHLPHRDIGPFHLGTVFLEARHDIGLLDVDLTGGYKNRTSSLMLGLSFVVGGP
jgi:hypothetical protein